MARLLKKALEHSSFEVELASELRSWEGKGNESAQKRIEKAGAWESEQLIAHYRALPKHQRPKAWFTYHLYHKAPDWIGPRVSAALSIPYFVAEASIAPKQEGGRWSTGYHASMDAVAQAKSVFCLNPKDVECIFKVQPKTRVVNLKPFLDVAPSPHNKSQIRQCISAARNINEHHYWLTSVAMMRNDSKRQSYLLLANAVALLERKDWQLLLIGDGPAKTEIKQAFNDRPNVHFLGMQSTDYIEDCLLASDLFVWPAINEAFGMSMLESLAAGLPVIAGDFGGVGQIVEDGKTGRLIKNINAAKLAQTIDDTLNSPRDIARMASRSLDKYFAEHSLNNAADTLRAEILKHV